MAKKQKQDDVKEGLPAWMGTYGDMVTLLLCFFVLLFSMSSVDVAKFKAAMSSFADQIDILPGGETLTDGELLNNGISQLNDINVVFQGAMAWDTEGDESTEPKEPEDENPDVSADGEEVDPYKLAVEVAEEFQAMIEEEGIEADVEITVSANYVKFTLQGEYLFDSGRANLKEQAKETIADIAAKASEQQFEQYDIQIEGHTDNIPISSTQFPSNRVLSYYRAHAVFEELVEEHGYDSTRIAETGYGEDRPIESNDTAEGRAANRRVEIKVILNNDEVTLEEYTLEQIGEKLQDDEEDSTNSQDGDESTGEEGVDSEGSNEDGTSSDTEGN